MIRITKMTNTYYGKSIDLDDEDDINDLSTFVREGTPCIIVEDLEDLDNLDIDSDEVVMC